MATTVKEAEGVMLSLRVMEPQQRSMLDVVKESLRASNRITFLHRVTYVGEHKLGRSLEEFMKGLISVQTEQYNDEPLTGFLLAYHAHFLHVVEGSESTLTRHLRTVTDPELPDASSVGSVKVLFETTHINKVEWLQRYFSTWSSRTATPPALAQPLETPAPVAEVARQADSVLSKTLRLVDLLKRLPPGPGGQLGQNSALVLPEPEQLQFLLSADQLKDVRTIIQEHDVPPRLVLYDDIVWPMQSDYVPYNILDLTPPGPGEDQSAEQAIEANGAA